MILSTEGEVTGPSLPARTATISGIKIPASSLSGPPGCWEDAQTFIPELVSDTLWTFIVPAEPGRLPKVWLGRQSGCSSQVTRKPSRHRAEAAQTPAARDLIFVSPEHRQERRSSISNQLRMDRA